jgi:hypothetical protein
MELADGVARAVACTICKHEILPDLRLRLGIFHDWTVHSEDRCLCVLVSGDETQDHWHEILVHGKQEDRYAITCPLNLSTNSASVTVRFVDPNVNDTKSWRTAKPKHHTCICEALRKHTPIQSAWGSLSLELDPRCNGVKGHELQERTYNAAALTQQRTLKSLLSSTSKDWTSFAKLTLAVMVSYSLCYLYGSMWASERWSRLNIIFFSDGKHTPLRPFLSSDPMKLRGPLNDPDGQHQYPELLELGIILLEIHLGRSLENFLEHKEKISNYDDLWLESLRAFRKRRLHIESLVHREAIKRCLAPDFLMSGTCDSETLRKTIYQEVVRPLEQELLKNFRDEFTSLQRLDDTAEQNIDLGPGFLNPRLTSVATRYLPALPSATLPRHGSVSPPSTNLIIGQSHSPSVPDQPVPFELFGKEDQEQPVEPLGKEYVTAHNFCYMYYFAYIAPDTGRPRSGRASFHLYLISISMAFGNTQPVH